MACRFSSTAPILLDALLAGPGQPIQQRQEGGRGRRAAKVRREERRRHCQIKCLNAWRRPQRELVAGHVMLTHRSRSWVGWRAALCLM